MSTYSFMDSQCSLTADGVSINLGYGAAVADEGITIAMDDAKNNKIIGADGEGMHSLRASKSGKITISLLKTSPANAKLSNLYDKQSSSSKKWGKNTITFNNTASGDSATATKCAFEKKPDMKNGKDGSIVEWVFDAIKIDMIFGIYE